MRKLVWVLTLMALLPLAAMADHITGGEMYYTLVSVSGSTYNYNVTLKLFKRCNSGRSFNDPSIVSIFDRVTSRRVADISVRLAREETIAITEPDPCISNPPQVCYEVGYFEFPISLPASLNGYVIASQVNYRIDGINNLEPGYNRIGALYAAEIPGNGAVADGPSNNSALFTGSDLVIVCANNRFTYSFGAVDSDGDTLRYRFCSAYKSSPNSTPGASAAPPLPPFEEVPYGIDFNGNNPLGGTVVIDASTGLLSGIAPDAGVYVVTVCVDEIRNGRVIAVQRKDLQINIASCGITSAVLEPEYQLCRDSKRLLAENKSTSALVKDYDWQILTTSGSIIYQSNAPRLDYEFKDTGTYFLKLAINRGDACTDSAISPVRVYPGFKPTFNFSGLCLSKPSFFTDASTTSFGIVNYWRWDFGEATIGNDTSRIRNPNFTYPSDGLKTVTLISGNSKGCRDTIKNTLPISKTPPLQFAFRDTLICRGDVVPLVSNATGNIRWTPTQTLSPTTGNTVLASPATTTVYYADLDAGGCSNRDSLRVRVITQVSLQVMADTTICQGDAVRLRIISDGLQFSWSPATLVSNPFIPSPFANPGADTRYAVTATVGGCDASASINVRTVPYPTAFAGNDTTICFGTSALLYAKTDGNVVQWIPGVTGTRPSTAPVSVVPIGTTWYTLLAYDNKGCPKPGVDSLLVTVRPDIRAYAGNDTTAVLGQDVKLRGTGGIRFQWVPATNLSASDIPDPVARFEEPVDEVRYKMLSYDAFGCADSAFITIKVFSTGPTVFVPTGFTPNRDGLNDVLRPTLAGITKLEYFTVFNRFGQMVFSTSTPGRGWDGTIKGQLQATGTFVWIVQAVDYNGRTFSQKGTSVLIR